LSFYYHSDQKGGNTTPYSSIAIERSVTPEKYTTLNKY